MKKLAYILSLLAAAAFTVVSCQKEVEKHEPGPKEAAGCYGVFFPSQDASGSHVYNPTQDKSIDIIVKRTSTNGAITVPVKATFSEDGIFTMNDVSFADGQEETTFTLRFDNAKEGVNYSASFAIEDNNYASLYNSNPIALDFSVLCVEMKKFLNPKTGEPAVFTFTHNWSGSRGEGHATMEYYEVGGIRTCFFKSIDKDASGNPLGLWHGDPVADLTVRWYVGDQDSVLKPGTKASHKNNQGNDFVEIVTQYIGFDYNGGSWIATPSPADPINMYDYFWFWNMRGYSIEDLNGSWLDDANVEGSPDQGYPLGYYDGNGGFFCYPYYYIPGLGGWSPSGYDNYFIADGFTRVDYSFEVAADYPYGGVTPISVKAGMDISSIKYAVYEGELTATQVGNKVSAIIAGTDESEEFSEFQVDEEEAIKYATLGVSPSASGTYTFVAVAYGAEAGATPEAQSSASVGFKFISADDEEKYAVDIDVFTEATPSRYKGLTEFDSFAFGIVGSEITDAHIAIIEASKLTNDFAATLKADEKGSYAASEEVLAKINGAGGYYDVASGLDPDTAYAVVVWATNGSEDVLAYDTFTTAAIPEVWKPLGTGLYTEDFFTTFFNVDPQTMEVEIEQSEDDPTRFRMIYPYDGKYPYNDVGDWDDSKSYDIVFTIPDANHVYIVPQKIGVDWGYGMFSIASAAGRYVAAGYGIDVIEKNEIPFGKLENGVITFPEEKSLLISMASYNNGSFYYANPNSAFKIVLPEGVNPLGIPAAAKVSKPSGMVSGSSLTVAPSLESRFERDPQPVKVNATVSYDRKAMGETSTIATRKAETR